MKNEFILQLLTVLFSSSMVVGQTVTTLPVSGLNGPNGFAIDSKDNLYIACEPGKKIYKYSTDGKLSLITETDSPGGLAIGPDNNLYISNFFSGTVLRLQGTKLDTVMKGLHHPSDLKFDSKGNLFVADYEEGTIVKLDAKGNKIVFAKNLDKPFGMTSDAFDNIYVACNTTGVIYKIDPGGVKTQFAIIPGTISYLAYSGKSRKIYIPCFTNHTIYVADSHGKVEKLCGNGVAGSKDGSLATAEFNGPNSIIISSVGDLFVSEFSVNRIRKIIRLEH